MHQESDEIIDAPLPLTLLVIILRPIGYNTMERRKVIDTRQE